MVTRYHPMLVALHWLLALLILGNLAVGMFVLDPLSNSDPQKAEVLRWHMIGGLTIGGLILVRLITRLSTAKPGPADGSRAAHLLARATHWGFYIAVIGMVVSGLGMAQLGGLFPLLGGEPVTLPRFSELPPQRGHALLANVLIVLLVLHLAGTAYHHLVKRENLLGRMWFGRRDGSR